jgi:hypothetical protein
MGWNHNICFDCWLDREPDRVPIRVMRRPERVCCFCGLKNRSGIDEE